jgi:hypothetical protein
MSNLRDKKGQEKHAKKVAARKPQPNVKKEAAPKGK